MKKCIHCDTVSSSSNFYSGRNVCKICYTAQVRRRENVYSNTPPVLVKRCIDCGQDKSSSEYHLNSASKTGLNSRCKECRYLYRIDTDPSFSGSQAAAKAAKHNEKYCPRCENYRPLSEFHNSSSNPTGKGKYSHCKECVMIYKRHPRRQRVKDTKNPLTTKQWEQIKARYEYRCLSCGKQEPDIKLTIDHIVPLSKNGTHCKDNVQPVCLPCNVKKNTQTVDYRPYWDKNEN